ncbi:MAG: alanine--tRNA ligase [Bacteroidia bacterium]|nr:MAG: alanine--tRNA ligase [Bacteroidia bacterium]
MTSRDLRSAFLKFFEDRGHTIVPSGPVFPFDDPTLLFTNAGMNQFKDVFLGTGKRPYTRAVDTQKCIRVSGKHNDLEEVGRDTYHHTFFEMLGNWSFGDYYKKEAIAWAWELLTKEWGLSKKRLWATVFTDDDEAANLWRTVTDIDPSHILRFGRKENFWEMGDTGPCGPCSEIHIDRTPAGTADASLVNAGRADVMEIWNLVFIQYDRDASGTLTPLPAKHVDTGMGFERMCAVMQGKNSNYDTDVFSPLIGTLSTISGKSYDGRMDPGLPREQSEIDTAMRVIADHVRALTFALADGAVPSNEGRGYVLRRILRRAARFGRTLGFHEPFLHKLVPTLVQTMGDVFPEITARRSHVADIIKGEEEGFGATLDRGLEMFDEMVRNLERSNRTMISGEDAFKLYDTFGFPFDLTQLMAGERGLTVDEERFNKLLDQQRTRSRESARRAETPSALKLMLKESAPETRFTGYDTLEEPDALVQAAVGEFVVLDKTPFYGEAGGQVGDTGILEGSMGRAVVLDTQRDGAVIAHRIIGETRKMIGRSVRARVDKERRSEIMKNHTATHLLHAALRQILGTHVRQAGSLVAPDHLRFDFTHHSALERAQLDDIEALVNEKIREHIPLTHHRNIPFEEAKRMGALMFFGDKYGDRVNVVQFGEFSKEFCGGTHVASTSDIGFFKFRSEGSVSSGTRRIEAVTSDRAREFLALREREFGERAAYAENQISMVESMITEAGRLGSTQAEAASGAIRKLEAELERVRKSASAAPANLLSGFADQDLRRRGLEDIILGLVDLRKLMEKEISRLRVRSLAADIDTLIQRGTPLNGARLVSAEVSVGSMDELKSLGDRLREKIGSGVGLLASVMDQKVALVCVVTDDLIAAKKLEAGKIVGAVARLLGGGGGGRPHLATAGGRDVSKLGDALKTTESIVRSFLNP